GRGRARPEQCAGRPARTAPGSHSEAARSHDIAPAERRGGRASAPGVGLWLPGGRPSATTTTGRPPPPRPAHSGTGSRADGLTARRLATPTPGRGPRRPRPAAAAQARWRLPTGAYPERRTPPRT